MNQALAVQRYVIIERAVKNQVQTTIERKYELHLFETMITSFQREFSIQNVYDPEFRKPILTV